MEFTVRANGNGAHIYVPKEWIGQPLEVITPTESFTKRPVKYGTGAHIYLPKRLEGLAVEIEKEEIKQEVIERLKPHLKDIEGAYLIGSCARGEQQNSSDIDILVITKDIEGMELKKEGQILFWPKSDIMNPNAENVIFLTNILRDARAIINAGLLTEIKDSFFERKKSIMPNISIDEDTAQTLKIMYLFFKGYDAAQNKKEYYNNFKYPLIAETPEEICGQNSMRYLIPNMFFAIRDLFDYFSYISDKPFSTKSMVSFFDNVPKFEEYYSTYKTDEYELYKIILIPDLKKIYKKCCEMRDKIKWAKIQESYTTHT